MNIKPDQLEDTIVKESQVKPKLPKNYKVILLNDDYTPMEFVVSILIEIFKHNPDTAQRVMAEVHETGSGIAGVYSFEIAEAKAVLCVTYPDFRMTAERIETCITSKTKAIVVVHYAGVAVEMDTIMQIANKHNLTVIEDNINYPLKCNSSLTMFYKRILLTNHV